MERDLIGDLDVFERTNDFWTLSRNELLLKQIEVEKRAGELTSRFNSKSKILVKSFHEITNKEVPQMGTVIFADVLEHVDNDVEFLLKARELLKYNGCVLISVPSYQFLWTKNDEVRGHKRRYSKKQLKNILEYTGYRVEKMFYWNLLSVPMILGAKILGARIPHESISESKLNNILSMYFTNIENKITVPFGSTLICVARKV
ncbi:MAG: hypothetical protein J4445_01665 [DPANN group archaeon]|nr:hypothetical protein [DPANN group archaeon]